jgi:hypothetical protein
MNARAVMTSHKQHDGEIGDFSSRRDNPKIGIGVWSDESQKGNCLVSAICFVFSLFVVL